MKIMIVKPNAQIHYANDGIFNAQAYLVDDTVEVDMDELEDKIWQDEFLQFINTPTPAYEHIPHIIEKFLLEQMEKKYERI